MSFKGTILAHSYWADPLNTVGPETAIYYTHIKLITYGSPEKLEKKVDNNIINIMIILIHNQYNSPLVITIDDESLKFHSKDILQPHGISFPIVAFKVTDVFTLVKIQWPSGFSNSNTSVNG